MEKTGIYIMVSEQNETIRNVITGKVSITNALKREIDDRLKDFLVKRTKSVYNKRTKGEYCLVFSKD